MPGNLTNISFDRQKIIQYLMSGFTVVDLCRQILDTSVLANFLHYQAFLKNSWKNNRLLLPYPGKS